MMNKSFSENTMEIINAIKEYRDKHGDDGIVEKYYEEHGTYNDINFAQCLSPPSFQNHPP